MSTRPARERNPQAKRERIARAALALFERQGFAETTIDQIAESAQVGRRTIFDHFPTKEAILFDHLVVRREAVLERLAERPATESPLRSLHTVLRELAQEGYDRKLLDQIRAVLASEQEIALRELSVGGVAFQEAVVEIFERRGDKASMLELQSLTEMATGWFLTAVRRYFQDSRRSLVRCFDDVVAACVDAAAQEFGPSS